MYSLTFRINLQNLPNEFQGQNEVEALALSKSVYLPISSTAGSPSIVRKHGDTFTLYGQHAAHFKRLVESGELPYCQIVETEEEVQLPTVTMDSLSVNMLYLTMQGTIVSEGSSPLIEYGFAYSAVNENPTIDDHVSTMAYTSFTGVYNDEFNVDAELDGQFLSGDVSVWVTAYAINSSGVSYGTPIQSDPNPYICLAQGTLVTLANGRQKRIEDISYSDKLLVWNFDEAKFDQAPPIWIMKPFTAPRYSSVKFSNGVELRTVPDGKGHSVFNVESGKFTHMMSKNTPMGTSTYTEKGKKIQVIGKEVVNKVATFYNVITNHHMNLFANGILTSTRLNNLYPIDNMQFIKEDRLGRPDLRVVSDGLYEGLRLAEQTGDIKNKVLRIAKYQG